MKPPILNTAGLAFAAGIFLSTPAFSVVTIDYVSVGFAGNAADPADGDPNTAGVQNFGAVAYAYQIGKYEVTNAQYTQFLNTADPSGVNANGIYSPDMGSNVRGGITFTPGAASGAKYTIRTSMGNKPVNFVSWVNAARFTNWLHNGQGSGSTETGAYTLAGLNGLIIKNVGATVWLPSENEWYKAAYYDPNKGGAGIGGYWAHATQSDTAPTVGTANAAGDISNPGANVANYFRGADWNSQDGNVTTVGSAAANNYFGTADQAGNVWEWNDVVNVFDRGLRGGSWRDPNSYLPASYRFLGAGPQLESNSVGFRVASVPEPSAVLLTFLAVGASLTRRRRSPL